MKRYYNVRFGMTFSTGNVSFYATSDDIARRKVKRIARDIGLSSSPWNLREGNRHVASGTCNFSEV